MELSLVVPVWNDLSGLERLLRQVVTLGIFTQVIIADDCSDVPPGPETLPDIAAALDGKMIWLRSDQRRGAGHARNMALGHVRGSHVIFFDSDDLFSAEFPQIVASAAEQTADFDFLMFRHDDSRMLDMGKQGSFPTEEDYWKRANATSVPTELAFDKTGILCGIAAYPWNKIYRTGFLRENQIQCTETMVHNDIELHWASFIAAKRILICTLTGAIHFVEDSGDRLTNRRDADRLDVFRTFENVMHRMTADTAHGRQRFVLPFANFSYNLIVWIGHNIDEHHRPELRARAQRHFLTSLNRQRMVLIAYADLELARKINRLILRGDLP